MMSKMPFQGLMWTLTSTPTKEEQNVWHGSQNCIDGTDAQDPIPFVVEPEYRERDCGTIEDYLVGISKEEQPDD